MSLSRRAARRDLNEPQIMGVFESAGGVVQQLSAKGVPDLLVSFLGVLHLVEVKRDNEPLTEDQKTWHDAWVRQGAQRPEIVRTEAHAHKLIRMWTMEFAEAQKFTPTMEDDLTYGTDTSGGQDLG